MIQDAEEIRECCKSEINARKEACVTRIELKETILCVRSRGGVRRREDHAQ